MTVKYDGTLFREIKPELVLDFFMYIMPVVFDIRDVGVDHENDKI